MTTTTLNQLIGRMNVYTPINNMDVVRKVNALDQAVRMFRTSNQPPWTQKKTTLRVFSNVYLYPVAYDHAQLAMLDDQLGTDGDFGEHPRYVYTSLRDFLEDPTARNSVAEIWQSGTRFLGVNNKTDVGLTQSLADGADLAADWAGSGDAGTPVIERVLFITGNSSIRVPVTNSAGSFTVLDTFQNQTVDSQYQRKYFFAWVYLANVPTSIDMQVRKDGSNYLSANVTTQFSGAPFVANDWNQIAMDLNVATATGTVDGTFNSAQYTVNGSVTGSYYFDASYFRGWILQDYWYYSDLNVLNSDGTYAMYFAPDSATYDLSAVLLGDTAWHDPVMYEACTYLLSDQKEENILNDVRDNREKSWAAYYQKYPDNTPQITTNTYRFGTDYQGEMGWPDILVRG